VTNVVRLRELLKTQSMSAQASVYYDRGVGTGALERIRGGAIGYGLSESIRRAYRFLSETYLPGDRVFIFGFSRGAYTARSLVGMVTAAGLLRRENCTPNLEASAWFHYRASPKGRAPAV